MLVSVFYDLGKLAFEQCPPGFTPDLNDCQTKKYFLSCLEQFIDRFPNLGLRNANLVLADCKIVVGNGTVLNPHSFVQKAARNGFAAGMRKKLQRSNQKMIQY